MGGDSGNVIYWVDKNGNAECFMPESGGWQNAENDRAEREMVEKEQEKRSAAELESLRKMLKAREEENERFRAMISSATNQYNELMHVAEQYRNEAIKWRSKFTF